MKSFSKIISTASTARLETWNVADLDVESNVNAADVEMQQIMMLLGSGKEDRPGPLTRESGLAFHPGGLNLDIANWYPNDLDQLLITGEHPEWEFMEPSNDFFRIPEQQILQEKQEAEIERIELIKQAHAEANEILHAAHLEAEKLILRAQEEIEEEKKKAYKAAYQEMQSALAATRTLVEETRLWQFAFTQSGEQILTGMMKEIAQTMFGEGINLDSNALQINLNRIMENAQRLGDLNIYLNPHDANLLDPSWSDYQLLITGNKVRIVPSEKILPGGCFVKGSTGAVDARVETQLAAVLDTIDQTSGTGR
jgi:flagellar assembly protein FliH